MNALCKAQGKVVRRRTRRHDHQQDRRLALALSVPKGLSGDDG
jgi:hypothetical protein